MTVLISKEFQTKSEMVAAKKQLKAEIHGTFDLERQEVRIPNGLIILQRKTSAKRELASDFGIFRDYENAYRRMEQLRKKGADKKWPTFNRYQPLKN